MLYMTVALSTPGHIPFAAPRFHWFNLSEWQGRFFDAYKHIIVSDGQHNAIHDYL